MSLEKALKGEEPLRIMTITRSVSNNLIINTEREMLLSAIDLLTTGNKHVFSEFNKILTEDVEKYLKILGRIKDLRSSHESELLVIKMKNLIKGVISVEDKILNQFIADVLKKGGVIKKEDSWFRDLFKEKANDIWENLSQFDPKILEIKIHDILQITDSDVLNCFGALNEAAIYQSIKEIISAIKLDYHTISNQKEDLTKALGKYYLEQFNTLMQDINKARKLYQPAITMLVTNEYFWGKVPVEVKEARALMSKWSNLPNMLFCSNFLLIDELKDHTMPKKLASALNELHSKDHKTKKISLMESEYFAPEYGAHYEMSVPSFQKYLEYLNKAEPTAVKGIFKNESMIFWNRHLLTTYDKATYVDEQENIFPKGFIYEFGLGLDNIGEEIPESKIVHSLVSTQICRDLLAQIRINDEGMQRYHILQSNTINFNGEVIPKNVVYVIHINFGSPSIIYKRALHLSSIPVDKSHIWDQVGPFDWHINFQLGPSNYSIQTLSIN